MYEVRLMQRDRAQEQKNIFANNLKRIMDLRHVSQADIVEKIGITSSTASDWVNARKYPRVDKMQLLAELLHVSISELREPHNAEEEEKKQIESAKVALFGGAGEVTDAMWEEVVNFAKYVEAREAAKRNENK